MRVVNLRYDTLPPTLNESVCQVSMLLALVLAFATLGSTPGLAQSTCQLPPAEIERKAMLRVAAATSDQAWADYTQIVAQHRDFLVQCRQQQWPRVQGIWLRLYPCDANPGVLDEVMDRLVDRGYNRVFIEIYGDGRSILPTREAEPWPSISPDTDLLSLAIASARRRGISPYAWFFSLNFGYGYTTNPNYEQVLARNGRGSTSLIEPLTAAAAGNLDDVAGPDQVFADPFHPQARQDLLGLVQRSLQRQPDGAVFDYIRYPRGAGAASVADSVDDLWIYGETAREEFLGLAENAAGRDLLSRFLDQGFITTNDVQTLDRTHGQQPRWRQPGETRPEPTPSPSSSTATPTTAPVAIASASERQNRWQQQLWPLAINFARFGIVDFLNAVSQPVRQASRPTGAVFFPEGEDVIGAGYDSRLQPWTEFTQMQEWHPMAYALCDAASCIGDQVARVVQAAPANIQVCPAIAGRWGETVNRPALEVQMRELQTRFPELSCVSHWAYNWIEPASDQARRTCRVTQ